MNGDMLLVGVVVLAAVVMFVWGKVRIDIVALGVLAILFVLKLIEPDQVLYGLANTATVTVAAMFVISAGLMRTGLVEWTARELDKVAGKTQFRLLLILSLTAALLSAFIINAAIVAIFIPVTVVLSRSRKFAPSKMLIPLSFASQFGGFCTIVGTSTNLIVNAVAVDQGLKPFGFFEFLPLGVAMLGAGLVYLAVLGRWLLPERKAEAEQVDRYRLADYLAELEVKEKSPLIGHYWEKSPAAGSTVEMSNLLRGTKFVSHPSHTKLRAGDILVLHGNVDEILAMESRYGLEILRNARVKDEEMNSHNMKMSEVLVPPGSNLVGRGFRDTDFFTRHHLDVLAVQRRGHTMREGLLDLKLRANDTLLIIGHEDTIVHIMNSPNVIVTDEMTQLYVRKDRATTALAVLALVVVVAAFNVLPIMEAAILGAVLMVLGRCLTIEEAYASIDWQIIFLLAGVLPLGLALQQSGATYWLAAHVLEPLAGHGPELLVAALYLVTAVFTGMVSNNAAAAILAPIAFTTAVSLGIDPRPLLVTVTFAASTSFATPIGNPTNTMVFSPGGYKFTDFVKAGLPLNLVFWGLAVLLIPRLWPF